MSQILRLAYKHQRVWFREVEVLGEVLLNHYQVLTHKRNGQKQALYMESQEFIVSLIKGLLLFQFQQFRLCTVKRIYTLTFWYFPLLALHHWGQWQLQMLWLGWDFRGSSQHPHWWFLPLPYKIIHNCSYLFVSMVWGLHCALILHYNYCCWVWCALHVLIRVLFYLLFLSPNTVFMQCLSWTCLMATLRALCRLLLASGPIIVGTQRVHSTYSLLFLISCRSISSRCYKTRLYRAKQKVKQSECQLLGLRLFLVGASLPAGKHKNLGSVVLI